MLIIAFANIVSERTSLGVSSTLRSCTLRRSAHRHVLVSSRSNSGIGKSHSCQLPSCVSRSSIAVTAPKEWALLRLSWSRSTNTSEY